MQNDIHSGDLAVNLDIRLDNRAIDLPKSLKHYDARHKWMQQSWLKTLSDRENTASMWTRWQDSWCRMLWG
jgi:hypothetical protein